MGDYRDKSGSERVDAPEKIDLTNVMLDVYHGVKRLWWLFIGLIIICAVQAYFSVCPADGGSVPVYSYQWCTEGCSC